MVKGLDPDLSDLGRCQKYHGGSRSPTAHIVEGPEKETR